MEFLCKFFSLRSLCLLLLIRSAFFGSIASAFLQRLNQDLPDLALLHATRGKFEPLKCGRLTLRWDNFELPQQQARDGIAVFNFSERGIFAFKVVQADHAANSPAPGSELFNDLFFLFEFV